jgi:DNA-binding NarL/FixJ family response regulator
MRLGREPDLHVLPVATDAQAARALLRAWVPSVVLLDLILGPTSGLGLLDEIEAGYPGCGVIVLTGVSGTDKVVEAVRRGARAWLPKTVDVDHLVRVIRGVSRGEYWIPPDVLGQVLRQLIIGRPPDRADSLTVLTVLTARERDVLQCAVDGLSRSAIARRLFLSPHTVRTHTQNVLLKLSAHSMVEAVSLARRHGMRPADEAAAV